MALLSSPTEFIITRQAKGSDDGLSLYGEVVVIACSSSLHRTPRYSDTAKFDRASPLPCRPSATVPAYGSVLYRIRVSFKPLTLLPYN